MAYIDVLFPTRVSDGSRSGPVFKTRVLEYESGFESVDQKWPNPRQRYTVAANTLDVDELDELWNFWFAVGAGRFNSFRHYDEWDHKSCSYASDISPTDQLLLENPSTTVTSIQLIKNYIFGTQIFARTITKPIASTVVLSVDGSTRTTGISVNSSTGMLTLSPAIASTVASVRAGFEYWVHVRFDTDQLDLEYEGGIIGNTTIPLIEKLEA